MPGESVDLTERFITLKMKTGMRLVAVWRRKSMRRAIFKAFPLKIGKRTSCLEECLHSAVLFSSIAGLCSVKLLS